MRIALQILAIVVMIIFTISLIYPRYMSMYKRWQKVSLLVIGGFLFVLTLLVAEDFNVFSQSKTWELIESLFGKGNP
ncbi:hypothetical protein SAMN04487969_12931 [Paenibacillus algorifonticola]|uniref:Uncharacterized protein n=1 Tax=Paenibacillus algorifonticola TaxID=684063 RepID=A0A1I2I222_9BACL|nr:hypothetical protein [Paenibacillus algorifonticola]SFF35728.1 hypothetical protein SAMN04487969_12931 [Paenibacillus algorifonticola]